MNFTIEQKERITELLSSICVRIYRPKIIASELEKSKNLNIGTALLARDARVDLEHVERYVEELKHYLMEIE